jgi:hypothetical protein
MEKGFQRQIQAQKIVAFRYCFIIKLVKLHVMVCILKKKIDQNIFFFKQYHTHTHEGEGGFAEISPLLHNTLPKMTTRIVEKNWKNAIF